MTCAECGVWPAQCAACKCCEECCLCDRHMVGRFDRDELGIDPEEDENVV